MGNQVSHAITGLAKVLLLGVVAFFFVGVLSTFYIGSVVEEYMPEERTPVSEYIRNYMDLEDLAVQFHRMSSNSQIEVLSEDKVIIWLPPNWDNQRFRSSWNLFNIPNRAQHKRILANRYLHAGWANPSVRTETIEVIPFYFSVEFIRGKRAFYYNQRSESSRIILRKE